MDGLSADEIESKDVSTSAVLPTEGAANLPEAKSRKSRWRRPAAEPTQPLDSARDQEACVATLLNVVPLSEDQEVCVATLLRVGPLSEEATRAENARAASGRKGENARIAHETIKIIEVGGYYAPNLGDWVDVSSSVQAAVMASTHYPSTPWHRPPLQAPAFRNAELIEVRCCTCLAAAQELAALQEEGSSSPGVLNFASARNPGGGFSTGASAQEESIARSSALYPCLSKHFDAFFVPNRSARSGAYTHDMIYSPKVPVFLDDEGRLLESWYSADFLTCAAPNLGVLRTRETAKEAEQIASDSLRERITRMLHVFAQHGVVDVVLGAWGCGVFKNSPAVVASLFKEQLNGKFRGHFRRVIFAVLDVEMAQTFADTFCVEMGGRVPGRGDNARDKRAKGTGKGYKR